MYRIEHASKPLIPQFEAVRLKKLAELTLELKQLGDSTPPPYNYRYDRVEFCGPAIYLLRSEDGKNTSQIPKTISSLYSPEEQRSHNEMIGSLDNYFRIKKEIHDLQRELVISKSSETVEWGKWDDLYSPRDLF